MDAAFDFAKHIVSVKYEDIPPQAVEITKRSILDTLGTTCAASTAAPGCRQLVELVKESGGREESSIVAFGGKVPAWMAAFANGAMSHSLDYDDVHDEAVVHPGVATVPAAFAIAERVGKVDGREFITAVCLGADVLLRLALAGAKSRGFNWLSAQLYGSFSATTVCGRLLGLDEEKMVDAFGIALAQASGSLESGIGVGAIIRGMWPAFPGKAGILSALMAQRGISGSKNSIEGKAGLYNAYLNGEYDRDCLTAELGKSFEIANSSFKPWPCCRAVHPYIDATLRLVNDHDIQPQSIDEITVFVAEIAQLLCQPLEARRNPETSLDAKFSIPFSVAVAAASRKVLIKDFTPEGLKDPEVLQLAQKVVPKFDSGLSIIEHAIPPAIVEIKTKGGETYSKRIDVCLGHPKNPMTREQLTEKFKDCVSYSAKSVSEQDVERVIWMVDNLEELDDVARIMRLLA